MQAQLRRYESSLAAWPGVAWTAVPQGSVARGNGIACLSDFMTQPDVKRGDLVELLVPDTMRISMPLHAVYYSDQTVSTRIRCFIDFLSEKLNPASPA